MSPETERRADAHELFTPFGHFALSGHEAISFPSGIPGFEDCRRFVLLSAEELAPLSCLQSVEGPPASFLVIDPRLILHDYRCMLGQTDMVRLGVTQAGVLLWLALVSFDEGQRTYVNLRAPIVINPERMLGYQVMPHHSLYPLRHPLPSE